MAVKTVGTMASDGNMFDDTNPAALGVAAPGTAIIAARRDHVHAGVAGGVSDVTGTAPIVSSGGAAPDISIVAATASVPGSMSAAHYTKVNDQATGYIAVDRNGVDQTGCTGGANNKILFTTERADDNGWFDSGANSRYTPLAVGKYMVILSVGAQANGDSPQAALYKNGAPTSYGTYWSAGAGTGNISNGYTDIVSMNGTTDYLEGWVYLPATRTVIRGSGGETYMRIIKL